MLWPFTKPRKGYWALVTFVSIFTILTIWNQSTVLVQNKNLVASYDPDHCGCPRFGASLSHLEKQEESLCSHWSTVRGVGQNVLSYSIFGGQRDDIFRNFYSQIEERIREADFYYPGWLVRLYHNTSKVEDRVWHKLCSLYCKYPQFDLCDVNTLYIPPSWNMSIDEILSAKNSTYNIKDFILSLLNSIKKPKTVDLASERASEVNDGSPTQEDKNISSKIAEDLKNITNQSNDQELNFSNLLPGKMWRFAVMADPMVDTFLIRDLDSYILPREVAAVEEWIRNSSAFTHSMRDHPSHNGFILAGLWGGSRTRGGDTLRSLFQSILKLPVDHSSQYDQQVLQDVVWPEVQHHMLIHDSYHCINPILALTNTPRPFPTRRRGRMFVSWGPFRTPSELTLIGPCPKPCRPKGHMEWTFC